MTSSRPGAANDFGRTWWGREFLGALTDRARLDPKRLVRGRAHARDGRVRGLTIVAGAVGAYVQGSRPRPYSVIINLPMFDQDVWTGLLDSMAAQIGHLAALLDGELPPGIGSELLPGPGELSINCSCPDQAEPCKHAAAVCYLVADTLDADPFTLLVLRGRTKDEVLSALHERRRPAWSTPPGMLARDAFRQAVAQLPPARLPPRRPGDPVPLSAEPPTTAGVRSQDLADLAATAARRAWELLRG